MAIAIEVIMKRIRMTPEARSFPKNSVTSLFGFVFISVGPGMLDNQSD
jgi:hypothetical protein